MDATILLAAAWMASATPLVVIRTLLNEAGLTTKNAMADQAGLCTAGNDAYPDQFTWMAAQNQQKVRDATPADRLKPRIEQHRLIGGADTVVAVWTSFSSNPATCSEPFQTAPAQPETGQPFTAVQMLPYTPAALQAMADSGCGPFGNTSHVDLFRLWMPGDNFLVYPAVYTGSVTPDGVVSNNNITLLPRADYYTGNTVPVYSPDNITIRGLTRNGIRPVIIRNDSGAGDSETSKDVVELGGGTNDRIENIGVTLGPNGYVLQAGLYLLQVGYDGYDTYGNALAVPTLGPAPNHTTIAHMHIHGFEQVQAQSGGANGVTGTTLAGGTVVFFANEIDHNGGSGAQSSSGLAHGVYMSASNTAAGNPTYDPGFTVVFQNNWFHDQFFGHDAKSRAQHNVFVGNYFQGGLPQGGIYSQADAFNVDVPNGGVLVARNNIFVKNASGYNSGLYGTAYGEEGFPMAPYDGPRGGPRVNSIDVQFNTYVAFSSTEDGIHALTPFKFLEPAQVPGSPGFPVSHVSVDSNAFVGYCPQNNPVQDYRGTTALTAGFSDLSQAFSFGGAFQSPSDVNVGTFNYFHEVTAGRRTSASVGGED